MGHVKYTIDFLIESLIYPIHPVFLPYTSP